MRSLLTVEVALGLLLVTSFTCVGLVALWAATSPRHWFLRVAGLVALLSPLLLIPAFEPLLIFAVQAVGVQIGVGAYRWRQRLNWQPTEGASGLNPPTSRQYTSFSLASAMLAVVLIAIGVAVIVRVPRDVWEDFPIQLLTGFILAVATLIAAWLACGRTTTRRRIVIAESVTLIASLALACLNDWSKMFSDTMAGAIANWPNVATPLFPFLTTIWLIVIPITGLAVVGLLKLYGQIHAADEASSQLGKPRQERLTKVSLLAILLIALALPPGLTVWKLAHPLPLPIVDLPSPNGYDDLVAVGKMFTSPILNTGVRPKSTSELREEVAKYAAAYDLARLGLSHKIVVPLIVPLGEAYPRLIDVDGSIRNVARALMMESELARREERYGDSASIAMENIRLGQAIASGGTLSEWLAGEGIEGIGQNDLYLVANQLPADACKMFSRNLVATEVNCEPIDAALLRDRSYSENAYGWYGHLLHLVHTIRGEPIYDYAKFRLYPRDIATERMLATQLALHAYLLERGMLPERLEELVPEFVAEIARDPFDSDGKPLRYFRTADSYVLYSVGPNRIDDDGTPPAKDDPTPGTPETGDLRLDTYFARARGNVDDEENDAGKLESGEQNVSATMPDGG